MLAVNAPVRYGIIGCAEIGEIHAESAQTAERVELVACADVDDETASTFAAEYGVSGTYTNAAEMVTDADLDAVSVCTPSGTHADFVVDVAEAGAHVLCEKPLDVYADGMTRMIDACDEADVTLASVFQKRFAPASQLAKDAIESTLFWRTVNRRLQAEMHGRRWTSSSQPTNRPGRARPCAQSMSECC